MDSRKFLDKGKTPLTLQLLIVALVDTDAQRSTFCPPGRMLIGGLDRFILNLDPIAFSLRVFP